MQFIWPVSSETPTSQAALLFAITGNEIAHGLDWVNLWSRGGMSVNWAGEVMDCGLDDMHIYIYIYIYILHVNGWLLGACLRNRRAKL